MSSPAVRTGRRSRAGLSELGVSALLAGLGVLVLVDALSLRATSAQVALGPAVVPLVVAGGLLACAVVLTYDVVRGGRGEAEGGEDVDLTHGSDWRTIGLLVAVFVANMVLIERLGFVISGALLFGGCALVLGSRRWLLTAIAAVLLSLATFYLFVVGLGIRLPAGILQGIL
jgi:putative tricarboxylic transport membrane protein